MRQVLWTLLAIFVPNGIGILIYFLMRQKPCVTCHRVPQDSNHPQSNSQEFSTVFTIEPPVRHYRAFGVPTGAGASDSAAGRTQLCSLARWK
jgi:hypothetical protein